jgi:hypothetical protein
MEIRQRDKIARHGFNEWAQGEKAVASRELSRASYAIRMFNRWGVQFVDTGI